MAELSGNHFKRGAQATREMMARFVEVTHPEIAASIRANWHPGWGEDPGRPDAIVDTWEPVPCPEGEAAWAANLATERPEPDLEATARMLETWGPIVEPASPDGRVSFTRGMLTSAAQSIRASLALLNTPEVEEFAKGAVAEAQHQRARWPSEQDAGKSPLDWFWLIGFLAQKAAFSAIAGDVEKAKHHTISTAAALANWHAAIAGDHNSMRPGIEPAAEMEPANG